MKSFRSPLSHILILLVVVFYTIPISTFTDNQEAFLHLVGLLFPFLMLLLTFLIFMELVSIPESVSKFTSPFFFIAIFVLARSIWSPLPNEFISNSGDIALQDISALTFITELVILVICCGLYLLSRRKNLLKPEHSFIVSVFLFIGGTGDMLIRTSEETHLFDVSSNKDFVGAPAPPPSHLARPNIYHLVFDGLGTKDFIRSIKSLELENEFAGFKFYTNTIANYQTTNWSVPSYLTGSIVDVENGAKVIEWIETALKNGGLIGKLYSNGYIIEQSNFEDSLHGYTHSKSSYIRLTGDFLPRTSYSSYVIRLLDISFLRVVPLSLLKFIYSDGALPLTVRYLESVSNGTHSRDLREGIQLANLKQFQSLLGSLDQRPQQNYYLYSHLWTPHWPFILDSNCNYRLSDENQDKKVLEQYKCITKEIATFIARLKELNIYDSSFIIVHGDHGPHDRERHKAALMIKPPHADDSPLSFSDKFVQLIDVANTILDAVGIADRLPGGGYPILSDDFPRKRSVENFPTTFGEWAASRRLKHRTFVSPSEFYWVTE